MSKTDTTNEEELRHHLALALRVLFPNEAWDTYIRSAVCVIHEVRNHPRKERADKNWCCKVGCGKHAEWRIWDVPRTPDNYTEVCADHVGEMLHSHHDIEPIEVFHAEDDPDIPDNELVRDDGQFGMGE
jgi:hypothetical protein